MWIANIDQNNHKAVTKCLFWCGTRFLPSITDIFHHLLYSIYNKKKLTSKWQIRNLAENPSNLDTLNNFLKYVNRICFLNLKKWKKLFFIFFPLLKFYEDILSDKLSFFRSSIAFFLKKQKLSSFHFLSLVLCQKNCQK